MKAIWISVFAVTLGSGVMPHAQAAGNITTSTGMPPEVAAKFARTMARNRLAALAGTGTSVLPDGTVVSNGGGVASPGGSTNCITNIGTPQQPAVGSGLAFGPTGATQNSTIIISGDIFNVCK